MENRGYSEMTINIAIDRARSFPRSVTLKRNQKKRRQKDSIFFDL